MQRGQSSIASGSAAQYPGARLGIYPVFAIQNGRIAMRCFLMTVALLTSLSSVVFAHCQIPCGIYDDKARLDTLGENITTIERAMKMIVDLSDDAEIDHNQIVRWVDAKNHHADNTANIVSWYFLQQRVKPVDPGDEIAHKTYVRKISLLHSMLVHSMKAKQTTDISHVEKLRELLVDFSAIYLGE